MSFVALTVATASLMSAVAHGPTTGMTISPAQVASNATTSHAVFRVDDVGTSDIKVRISAVQLVPLKGHPGSWAVFGEADNYRVTDEAFTLHPREHKMIRVTIAAPHDDYRRDYGVSATSTPVASGGQASIQSQTVARFVIHPLGQPAPSQAPIAVGEPDKPSGTPTWTIAAIGGLVLALVAGTMRVLNIKRRKARANA